jgi:hypothetical protein
MKKTFKIISSAIITGAFVFIALGSGNDDKKEGWVNNSKESFCGKEFSMSHTTEGFDITTNSITILNCNGTYTSKQDRDISTINEASGYTLGQSKTNNATFSGTWEIVTDIPDEIKSSMTGFKDGEYTIIRYNSKNIKNRYAWIQPSDNNTLFLSLVVLESDNPPADGYIEEDYGLFGGFAHL